MMGGNLGMDKSEFKRLHHQMSGRTYTNNKTGGTYTTCGCEINSTNKDDGIIMVSYVRSDMLDCIRYCREYSEFIEKFTKVN